MGSMKNPLYWAVLIGMTILLMEQAQVENKKAAYERGGRHEAKVNGPELEPVTDASRTEASVCPELHQSYFCPEQQKHHINHNNIRS